MMKIKHTVTKEMRMDELIKWAWDNNIKSESFESNSGSWIVLDENSDICDVYKVEQRDRFTVETTEEIEVTENMKFPFVVMRWLIAYDRYDAITYTTSTIKEILCPGHDVHFIYLQNPDGSIGELIWSKEDGLR